MCQRTTPEGNNGRSVASSQCGASNRIRSTSFEQEVGHRAVAIGKGGVEGKAECALYRTETTGLIGQINSRISNTGEGSGSWSSSKEIKRYDGPALLTISNKRAGHGQAKVFYQLSYLKSTRSSPVPTSDQMFRPLVPVSPTTLLWL